MSDAAADSLVRIPRYRLLVAMGETLRAHELPSQGQVTIGRGEGAQVRIDHASVSRAHAVLKIGTELTVTDLGGVNGTLVVDLPNQREHDETQATRRLSNESFRVRVGDPLTFGSVTAFVECSLPDVDAEAADHLIVLEPAMRRAFEEAKLAAAADLAVLVLGETGVGKDLLARAVHDHSTRRNGTFLAINCSTFNLATIDGELFGYEKGAFTGATQARPGLIEAAHGGTLFLDEVGELPLEMQAKLLRVVEDRRVLKLGARKPKSVDVRLVAATNRDLQALVAAGTFRRDLFFRISAFTLWLPPLRERLLELDPLAHHFLSSAAKKLGKVVPNIAPEVKRALSAYSWPGNVRELKHVMERAAALCRGSQLTLDLLPAHLLSASRGAAEVALASNGESSQKAQLLNALEGIERERVLGALREAGGNQTLAAKRLGVARRTLIARLEQFGLPRPRKPRQ